MTKRGNILISGASFAGLATAFWMNKLGYHVTLVEVAKGLKKGGTPVNIEDRTIDIVRRMGLLEQIQANQIRNELMEFKSADDVTERSMSQTGESEAPEQYEIERDLLLHLMFDAVKGDIEVVFDDCIATFEQNTHGVSVAFTSGRTGMFDLLFGCDGIHSFVRKQCFGDEAAFSTYLGAYFSITIVNKLLIADNTTQLFNEPGKAIMLKGYNGKTDIVLCFASDEELPYDYRDEAQQRKLIADQFAGVGWRTPELLAEVTTSGTFYFDKLCQIHMPSWTQGRVALVGDAAYCASPAAGRGGSLAIDGAAALADAFANHPDDIERAFAQYDATFRPFIEAIQAYVVEFGVAFLIPKTEEAIRERNAQTSNEFAPAS